MINIKEIDFIHKKLNKYRVRYNSSSEIDNNNSPEKPTTSSSLGEPITISKDKSLNEENKNNNNNNEYAGFCNFPNAKDRIDRMNRMNSISLSRKSIFQQLYDYWKNENNRYKVIVTGIIISKNSSQGLEVSILKIQSIDLNHCTAESPSSNSMLQYLSTFQIHAVCPITEFNYNVSKEISYFLPGGAMKALIQSIDLENEEIKLSLDSSIFLSKSVEYFQNFQLGVYKPTSLDFETTKELDIILDNDKCLTNPHSYSKMMSLLELSEDEDSFFQTSHDTSFYSPTNTPIDYKYLRQYQNYEWARETVTKGIEIAKKGDFERAIGIYHQALDVDPDHKDAYVALGAAYANTNRYDKAIDHFKTALKLYPDDKNADRYLNATILRKQDEENRIKDIEEKKKQMAKSKEKEKEKEKHKDNELLSLINTKKLKNILEDEAKSKKRKEDKKDKKRSRSKERHGHHQKRDRSRSDS